MRRRNASSSKSRTASRTCSRPIRSTRIWSCWTVAYGDDVPQKSLTECEALLAKYPDMNAIMAPTTVAVAAAAQCVESAGVYPGGPNAKNGGVIVYGLGTPEQMAPFLKSGVVKGVDLWDPAKMGTTTVYLAKGLKDGTIKLGEGNTFEVPGLGTMTFGKNNLVDRRCVPDLHQGQRGPVQVLDSVDMTFGAG